MNYCCEHDIVNQFQEEAFTEEEQDEYVLMVFLGIITTSKLSTSYDVIIKSILERALIEGYGSTLAELTPGTAEYTLLKSFQDNIASFTSAKQYQQVREMSDLLGLDIGDFKIEASKIFKKYNETWLATEFETVINSAHSGAKWVQFEKNKSKKPFLTYRTQQDSRVRPEHQTLDGITKPVDDPFWDFYAPPNGWNCRCFLVSSSSATVTENVPITDISKEIPDLFKFNPGKTGTVVSTKHPYFDVKRGDKTLKKNNFNLPVQ